MVIHVHSTDGIGLLGTFCIHVYHVIFNLSADVVIIFQSTSAQNMRSHLSSHCKEIDIEYLIRRSNIHNLYSNGLGY